MRSSKEKNLKINAGISNSNCFSSILNSFTCSGNLPSPTPCDHHHILPKYKSNGCVHPNPNELPKSQPTPTNSHFLDHNGSLEAQVIKDSNPRQPGLVARLMGLESIPTFSQDSIMNLRSKSLNSLQLYIFPDTFLDHVNPSTPFSQYQRQKPCHRRIQTSSSVLSVEPSPSKEKLEALTCNVASKPEKRRNNGEFLKTKKVDGGNNERKTSKKKDNKGLVIGRRKGIGECTNGRKKALENKVDSSKCRVREIKSTNFGTKVKKEKGVCRIRSVDEFKVTLNESHVSKVGSAQPRVRRSSKKIVMDQQRDSTYEGSFQEQDLTSLQGKKLCSRKKEGAKDRLEMMAQVIRLTEEHVRDDEWFNVDENVKKLDVEFAGEILEVLINQFLDEILG